MFECRNQVEAAVWGVFAVIFVASAAVCRGRGRRRCAIAALAFAAFGVSDLIEVRTGAWWRPWWLLALKAGCLATLAWAWRDYRRRRPAA